tara:strand:- start:99 stop:464 length:366 start_codon:yes stop_codon:yes gene_type:complete
MKTLTFIDPRNNNCKVYHINGTSSLYGRIGCTMRSGVVKHDTESKKISKGYQKTMLVCIPYELAPYNKIKMFRYSNREWVAYGYLNGYYRPLGFTFNSDQIAQFEKFQVKFDHWNNLVRKI